MGKALIIRGANFSSIAVDTIEITVGQPTIQIDIYGVVAITSPNGEEIYYTTDGSTPTDQSTKYAGGFTVQNGTMVKAVCYFGGNYSEVVSQRYDGTLQAPVINITSKGVVTITATNNASIRYTVDGQTDPTSSTGTEYTEPFNVENGVVVKAIAYLTSGSTTISSSVTTSDPAVVVEGITPNKSLDTSSGAEISKTGYFISPYITIPEGTTTVRWGYAYVSDMKMACYVTKGTARKSKNPGASTTQYKDFAIADINDGSTVCPYVRICGAMGAGYATKYYVKADGVALWTYDGSTE